eukprot:SAG22_NODE_3129_length_1915_cov_1.469714_2_plen_52_part_00
MPWPQDTPGELGWQGDLSHDDAAVVALREELEAQAGIAGLVSPCSLIYFSS